jgi:hypothetical protein
MLSLALFSFDQRIQTMKTLKKLLPHDLLAVQLPMFYTQTLYTIIRIFVIIYGF